MSKVTQYEIKANELRIGNWIIDPDGEQMQIEELTPFPDDYVYMYRWDWLKHCKSIPLTEDWYKRMGFEMHPDWKDKRKDGSVAFLDLGYLFISCGMMGNSATLFDNSGLSTGIHFDFVHQIQNCYFALKQVEIPITAPIDK